ncbi:MAG: hypothetical protein HY874_08495 [Chloroflexi bacterium]|nr:hypothetical protein [Chloroflexota bacterium]
MLKFLAVSLVAAAALAASASIMSRSTSRVQAVVPYAPGDVFAGVGAGTIKHYDSAGVLKETLDTTSGSLLEAGMCFDAGGNLYTTNLTGTAGTMSKFDNAGNLLVASWGGPFSVYPESCVRDAAGHIYTGEMDDGLWGGGGGAAKLRKFDLSGALLTTYSPATERRGVDWIDLAADQCTMLYTSQGSRVKRFDVCNNAQLSDFATGLTEPCFGLRIRSNGEVMVACGAAEVGIPSRVYRLNSSGGIIQTYTTASVGESSSFYGLSLDPDCATFWTAGYHSGNIYRIDIATGSLVTSFTASPLASGMAGLAIFGEPACTPPTTTTPTHTPTSTPTPTPPVVSTAVALALDCDLVTPGVQDNCDVILGAPGVDVGVVLLNSTGGPIDFNSFDVRVRDADTSRMNPPPVLTGTNLDRNPDFNDPVVPGIWGCTPPLADTGMAGLGQAESKLACYTTSPVMIPASPPGLMLAVVHYTVPGGAPAGPIMLDISYARVADLFVGPSEECITGLPVTLSCSPATVNLVPPPPGSTATLTPTITPTPTNTSTPTKTPTWPSVAPSATPTAPFYVTVDCDPALAGIQVTCSYPVDAGALDVDVYLVSNSLLAETLGAFNFEVHAPDLTRLSPLPGLDLFLNSNPDFNDSLAGPWSCAGPNPNPNTGADGPGKAVSYLGCMAVFSPPQVYGAPLPAGGQLKLGTVHYQVPPGALPGSVPLVLSFVSAADIGANTLLLCNAQSPPPAFPIVSGPCVSGVVNLFEPPTATPTNTPTSTPTATPTPAVGMAKVPEGSVASGNVDLSVPKANLFLCVTGPCAGPGEGDLVVVEHVLNVATGDSNGDMVQDGLGAYEFNVEYDNFVIQSVNPSDIVFSAGGAGASRGPASCSFSLVLENIVRFGCVTTGPSPNGPIGSFDLAKLDLVPHPDLVNDIFPGNDNGVPTVIKDNGCELADVFGHPVLGSVSGGLLPTCGDLAVTVRILEGDLNLDCQVDVTDEQLIGVHYASVFGSAYYSTWFDLEPRQHDLDIDIKDLQKVFGRDGSTCQQPIPVQTPVDPPAPFG